MTCEERRDDIFLFAAESLEGRDGEELSAHLDNGCEICAGVGPQWGIGFSMSPLIDSRDPTHALECGNHAIPDFQRID